MRPLLLLPLALLAGPAQAEAPAYQKLLAHCQNQQPSFDCAKTIERIQAKSAISLRFSRAGPLLSIRTAQKTVRLRDRNNESDQDVSYIYLTYLADARLHVLYAHLWEGSSYLAIDHITGRQYPMLGFPAVSPDHKRAVTFSAAGEARYGANGVEVWELRKGRARVEYTYGPDASDWSPVDVRWSGPATVKVAGRCNPDLLEAKSCPKRLELKAGIWSVVNDD
ncbi:hypothetical protein [Polaromonas sp. JS666]|uniref:hypothetical protein n=1 Tax=Polaromonas sp. (strain JS666 / ATCC BAA-500) TaxID=296591 RepID=UPI000889DF9C|nr:hypothetical protein [Polaromonas sp. JS666]SDM38546.1 hypothetical protein SAMN05720382_101175 [Polaromonas sp. JS666]